MWGARSACVLLLMLLTGLAGADSRLGTEFAGVVIEDGRDSNDCLAIHSNVCAFDAEAGPSPGDARIDAYQRIYSLRIYYNNDRAPYLWLLPDGILAVDGESIYIMNPLIPAATEAWNAHEPERPMRESAGVTLNETAAAVYYVGPHPEEPLGDSRRRDVGGAYATEGQGVDYDRVGPFNAPKGSDTDTYAASFDSITCEVSDAPGCQEVWTSVLSTYVDATPNLEWGLEVYNVSAGAGTGTFNGSSVNVSTLGPMRHGQSPERPLKRGPEPSGFYNPGGARAKFIEPTPGVRPPPPTAGEGAKLSTALIREPDGPGDLITKAITLAVILAAAGLYSRFTTQSEVLESKMRKRLLDIVAREPGIHLSKLSRELNVTRTAVGHHLRVLARLRLVETRMLEGTRVVFLPGQAAGEDSLGRAHPVKTPIFQALKAAPSGLTRAELHACAPSAPLRSRNYTITTMIENGLIERVEHPGEPRYRLREMPQASRERARLSA